MNILRGVMNTDRPQIEGRMLDSLPAKLPRGERYVVPEEVRADPGDLFAYVMAVCYGSDADYIAKATLRISRQTYWIWRTRGKGVPADKRHVLVDLLLDPRQAFRLPDNVASVDEMLRAPRSTRTSPARVPVKNYHLIDLLNRIVGAPEYGDPIFDAIIRHMARPVSNPYVFYRWAYAAGGVPASYMPSFLMALMQLRIYSLYGYTDANRAGWDGWAALHLAAPEGAEDTDDDDGAVLASDDETD